MTEREIRELAKRVARTTRKPFSTIEIPYTNDITQTVTQSVPTKKGWFVFEWTEYEEKEVPVHTSCAAFRREKIDGWILRTFYENCDEIVYRAGEVTYRERSISKTYYVLKKNGELAILEIGYDIESFKTPYEKIKFWRNLCEKPVLFPADNSAGLGSAYALDLKPIKWQNRYKKLANEVRYFKRNIPYFYGTCESQGQSYAIYKPGEGIAQALQKFLP